MTHHGLASEGDALDPERRQNGGVVVWHRKPHDIEPVALGRVQLNVWKRRVIETFGLTSEVSNIDPSLTRTVGATPAEF